MFVTYFIILKPYYILRKKFNIRNTDYNIFFHNFYFAIDVSSLVSSTIKCYYDQIFVDCVFS